MKCPKCGYHSFDHLDSCKKCGIDLENHKSKFNLRGLFAPAGGSPAAAIPRNEPAPATATPTAAPTTAPAREHASPEGDVDFGFDFLEEDAQADDSAQDLNLDQPFGIDSETLPADEPAPGKAKQKGSEFSF